ncbi:MAG: hypothetical protein L6R45_33870 [Anaerolineae bacterium]|nr:hypothetical protein [Anaerolineae bacterium]
MTVRLSLELFIYSLALWLGLYLLARNPARLPLAGAGLGLLAFAASLAANLLSGFAPTSTLAQTLTRWHETLPFLAALFWLVALLYLWPGASQRMRTLLCVAVCWLIGGTVLFAFPPAWLPRGWVLAALTVDFILLGLAAAVADARDEGQALLPDLFRSFDYSLGYALLFGGLVTAAMVWGTGLTFPMLALLLAVLAAATITQTFADAVQSNLDRLAFAHLPHLRRARADLRAAAGALPRLGPPVDFATLDEAEFTRLTRRALSHLGDLPRLAASPLTYLPIIETRLAQRNAPDNTLERAAELKSLLVESIDRLKPRDQGEFGATEAWRYYNALYFPYVAGLKPYSRRADPLNGHNPVSHQALEWFQTQVPERTLHNWQNAAAKLVAQDLKENLKQVAK